MSNKLPFHGGTPIISEFLPCPNFFSDDYNIVDSSFQTLADNTAFAPIFSPFFWVMVLTIRLFFHHI